MTDPIPVSDAIRACERLIARLDDFTGMGCCYNCSTARATLKPLAEYLLDEIQTGWMWPDAEVFIDHKVYSAVAAIIAHLEQTEPDWRTK